MNNQMSNSNQVLTAVGDISFMGRNADNLSAGVFEAISPVFQNSSLVVANLECPLLETGKQVAGKCALRGHPGWAELMADAGINLVSLANNHLMDYGRAGLMSTLKALDKAGIKHVGAGLNEEAACAPLLVETTVGRTAFLARTAVEVSSPSYAEHNKPGVAFFYEDEVLSTIHENAQDADLVVVMIHWGIENYNFPSPQQRCLAEKMIKAGAKLVLGHHPHVLQGAETISNGVVAYSLGNFLFDEFTWQTHAVGQCRKIDLALTKQNRQGVILKVKQDASGGLSFEEKFTCITDTAEVVLDDQLDRNKEFKRFCARLSTPFYDMAWKLYAMRSEWNLRIGKQLALRRFATKFYKIRPRHFVELIVSLKRSCKVAKGKSTNPYE